MSELVTMDGKRQRALTLLTEIPDSGLDELLEIMEDLKEFYIERDAYVPPPAPSRSPSREVMITKEIRRSAPIVIELDDDDY